MRMHTDEADGPADEGVEVASSSIDVGLSIGAAALPRLTAEEDGLSHHDLSTEGHMCAHGLEHSQEQQRHSSQKLGLTEMAGAANARLSSISRGTSSWAGSV